LYNSFCFFLRTNLYGRTGYVYTPSPMWLIQTEFNEIIARGNAFLIFHLNSLKYLYCFDNSGLKSLYRVLLTDFKRRLTFRPSVPSPQTYMHIYIFMYKLASEEGRFGWFEIPSVRPRIVRLWDRFRIFPRVSRNLLTVVI